MRVSVVKYFGSNPRREVTPAMIETWNVTIPRLTGDMPRRAYCYVPDAWKRTRRERYPVL